MPTKIVNCSSSGESAFEVEVNERLSIERLRLDHETALTFIVDQSMGSISQQTTRRGARRVGTGSRKPCGIKRLSWPMVPISQRPVCPDGHRSCFTTAS